MIFPIYLCFDFSSFDSSSFRTSLLKYEFYPNKTYFVRLFGLNGLRYGGVIPFTFSKSNGSNEQIIMDLFFKIKNIISYLDLDSLKKWEKRGAYYDKFTVCIFEDRPIL